VRIRKPKQQPEPELWGKFLPDDNPLLPPRPEQLGAITAPPRPIVDAATDNPNRVRCRACSRWVHLGDDVPQTLRGMWHAYAVDAANRAGAHWSEPLPEMPANPSKVTCVCGAWTELGDDVPARLQREWADYVDGLQERADAAWRQHPGHRVAAMFTARDAAELGAEGRERREVEARRDEAKGRRITALIEYGVSPLEAHAQADREFAGAQ
jgi:hypothetical protein